MRAIPFDGHNVVLGENQPEYEDLPAFVDKNEALCCFELTDEEILQIVQFKRIWFQQMIGPCGFAPIKIWVEHENC